MFWFHAICWSLDGVQYSSLYIPLFAWLHFFIESRDLYWGSFIKLFLTFNNDNDTDHNTDNNGTNDDESTNIINGNNDTGDNNDNDYKRW